MPGILLPSRRGAIAFPSSTAPIDRRHPLAPGLMQLFTGDSRGVDRVAGRIVTPYTGSGLTTTARGMALTNTGGTGSVAAIRGPTRFPYFQFGYGYWNSSGGAWTVSWLTSSATGTISRIALASSTTVNLGLQYFFGTTRSIAVTLPTTVGVPIAMLAQIFSDTDYRLYVNGRMATGTLSPGVFASAPLDRMVPPGDSLNGGMWQQGYGEGWAVSDGEALRITIDAQREMMSLLRLRAWVPVSVSGSISFSASLVDAAAGADLRSAAAALSVSLAEPAAGIDVSSASAVRSASLVDPLAGTDLASAQPTFAVGLVDPAAASDVQSTSAVASAGLVDSAGTADLQTAIATLLASLTEGVTAAELRSASMIANAAAIEAAVAADASSTATTYVGTALESAASAEALQAAAILVAQVVEAGGVIDQITAAQQLVVLFTDPVAGSDSASGTQASAFNVSIVDLAAALDVLSGALGGGVSLLPGRRRVVMPDVVRLQRSVQMPAYAALRRSVALYPA